MKGDFRILKLSEEKDLNSDELREYYKNLREYLKNRKLTNTSKGTDKVAPHLIKPTQKIAKSLTRALIGKDTEWICDGLENVPDGQCIFAYTHQGLLDNFIWSPFIDKHCPILHGAEVNRALLIAQLNTGFIKVIKGDKENNNNAKLDMISLLLKGHSLTYFPEGTWNLSPNKLHLPLSYGFLDTARKANVPVVPVAHEISYEMIEGKYKVTKVHTRFGKPIYISLEDKIEEKLMEYEEAISTLKYELIEEKGIYKRTDIDNYEYIDYLEKSYKDLKLGQLNLEKEKKYIFDGDNEFYKFHHINDVPYDEEGNLLETDEVIRLREINKKHRI